MKPKKKKKNDWQIGTNFLKVIVKLLLLLMTLNRNKSKYFAATIYIMNFNDDQMKLMKNAIIVSKMPI